MGKCGLYRYVEGDFHILLFAYAFDDDPVQIVDLASGEKLPQEIVNAIFDENVIKAAWNAQFERTCLSKYFGTQLSPDSWRCSMVHSASLSLPLALKTAAKILRVSEQKDSAGERLIKYYSVPCKPTKKNGGRTRNLPEHEENPGDWHKFKDYCLQDVRTERAIRKKLERFPMPEHEWDYYHMDQRINDRGVLIDTELVSRAIECDQIQTEVMTQKAYELTGLKNPNSVSQLKSWLEERGIPVETLGKKDVAAMITDLDKNSTDQEALDMLKLRLQMAKSSIKKYQAAERCACADGRARGLFQFSGANRTARWAGRFIQLQNLVRNEIYTLDEARELIKMGCFDMVASIYGNVPDILSQLIRTMLIPKPGCEFIVADFSAIEARVLAWLSGEQWRLDAFKRGEDIYCASASAMFGVPVVKHGINGELRAKGKVAELACIAEGQLVLTDCGYVPIENVKKFMSVWDGDGWVRHGGVIYKGLQNVINYDGLTATPDHLVYVDRNKQPVPFREIVDPNYTVEMGQMPVYDILNAGLRHRFLVSGKLVHNCGYQGGVGALTAMGALDMGLKEDDLPKLISDWRQANPNIVKFWWDLEQAAIATINDRLDRTVGKINVQYYANTLWLVLPSGRKLAYINPKLAPNRFGRMSLTYEGLNAANKWDHCETYGGKLAENCVAEGSLVLTKRGLVPIENVKLSDQVWDGTEWVHHEGIIYKGIQETVAVISKDYSYCNSCDSRYNQYSDHGKELGIYMTPDHKILTEKGWVECGKSEGLNWADVRLPDNFKADWFRKMGRSSMGCIMRMWKHHKRIPVRFNKTAISSTLLWLSAQKPSTRFNRSDIPLSYGIGTSREQRSRETPMALSMHLWKTSRCINLGFARQKVPNQVMRMHEESINKRSPKSTRNVSSPSICSLAQYEAEMLESKPSCISQLWWTRNYSLRSLDKQLREFLGRYGCILAGRFRVRSYRQQQRIQSRKLSMDRAKTKCQKQTYEQDNRFFAGKNVSVRTCRKNWYRRNNIALSSRPQLANRIFVHKTRCSQRVYDIRNCGSRHRFAVWDPGVKCLRIVSNCTQAASRDLLAEAMWRMEQAGLDIVAHVHDEVVLEVPMNTVTVDDVCKIMNQNPAWAEGLPLASAGYGGARYYFKD